MRANEHRGRASDQAKPDIPQATTDHGRNGGDSYMAAASAAASEVVSRLSASSEQQVIRRTMSYKPLKPLLKGQNDIAVLEKEGHHISIADPGWTYKFKEFHVTEEMGMGEENDPHFFFGDNGSYKKRDSWAHNKTLNYFNEIGEDQDQFDNTENDAKFHADDFLTDLGAKLAAEEPAATSAAPAVATPPPPVAAVKEPEDDGFTVVGKGGKKGKGGK